MKKVLFTIAAMLLPMLAGAQVEIDGIYYILDDEAKTAEVTSNPNKYQGDVAIPESFEYGGTTYGVTSIGAVAFWGCSGLTSVTIPDGVTSIGYEAFYGCSGLTSVTIPSSVKYIGERAFFRCSALTSVTIPDGVTSIDNYAFFRCSGLTSVNIGSGVTSIGWSAFESCSGLTDVFCRAESVPTTGNLAFYNSNIANATLHVPAGSVEAYKAAEQWNQFKEIVAMEGDGDYDPKFDLNGDGVVNAADVVMLVNYIAGKKTEE